MIKVQTVELEKLLADAFRREIKNRGFKISKILTKGSGLIVYWAVTMVKKVPFVATGYTRVSKGMPLYVDGKFVLADAYTYTQEKPEAEYVLVRVYGERNLVKAGLEFFVESVLSKYVSRYEARTRLVKLMTVGRSVLYVYRDGRKVRVSPKELKLILKEKIENDLNRIFAR